MVDLLGEKKDPGIPSGFAEIGERTRLAKRNLFAVSSLIILSGIVHGIDVSHAEVLGVSIAPSSLRVVCGVVFIYFSIQWTLQFQRDLAEFREFFHERYNVHYPLANLLFFRWGIRKKDAGHCHVGFAADHFRIIEDGEPERNRQEFSEIKIVSCEIRHCIAKSGRGYKICQCIVSEDLHPEYIDVRCPNLPVHSYLPIRSDAISSEHIIIGAKEYHVVRQQSIRFYLFDLMVPMTMILLSIWSLFWGDWSSS